MNKEEVLNAIKEVRSSSKKRNFSQTFDFQVRLQQLDLKKQDNKVETFATMPHSRGKKVNVCALVGGTLFKDAQEHCDKAIIEDDFKALGKDKKAMKKLVREYDFFIAQADKMPLVATSFGRFLGPLGKMPSPKAGGIVPPKGSTKNIFAKLQKTVKISVKTELSVKCPVGKEDMDDDDIAENIMAVFNVLVNALPQHENNIKSSILKLSMSKPIAIGGKKNE
jgi:large subunit ribosomal protein L1